MKKLIVLLLCLALALPILTACGGPGASNNGGGEKTLTIGVRTDADISDFKDNALTKWLEEETGYTLSFVELPSDLTQAEQMISTMALDNNLPDILWGFRLSDTLIRDYGKSKYFVDLSEYFADKEGASKVWWDGFNQLPEQDQFNMLKRMYEEDGAVYAIPGVETSMIDPMHYQPWINKNLLARSGMEAPTDAESLYQLLKKFKEMGVMPLVGQDNNDSLGGAVTNWLLNFFVNTTDKLTFNADANGNLYVPAMTQEYREGLAYIRKLVQEGLIPLATWTANGSEIRSYTSLKDGVGIYVGHMTINMTEGSQALYDFEALDCFGNVVFNENRHNRAVFITNTCTDVKGAFEVLMKLASDEGAKRMRYGEKGEDWDDADEGAVSALGLPADIKLYGDVWNTMNNCIWGAAFGTILLNAEGETVQLDEEATRWYKTKFQLMVDQYNNQSARYETQSKTDAAVILFYTEEEAEYLQQMKSDIEKYIKDFRAKCVKGELDPMDPATWSSYLDKLNNNLNIARYLELAQGAYDRDYK